MPRPTISDDVRELLDKPNPAVISMLRPDGHPVSVATWYLLEGDRVLVNMDAERRRLDFLRLDPRVSLTVLDEASWYSHVSLQGRVAEMYHDEGMADIRRLAKRYASGWSPEHGRSRISALIDVERVHYWAA